MSAYNSLIGGILAQKKTKNELFDTLWYAKMQVIVMPCLSGAKICFCRAVCLDIDG